MALRKLNYTPGVKKKYDWPPLLLFSGLFLTAVIKKVPGLLQNVLNIFTQDRQLFPFPTRNGEVIVLTVNQQSPARQPPHSPPPDLPLLPSPPYTAAASLNSKHVGGEMK